MCSVWRILAIYLFKNQVYCTIENPGLAIAMAIIVTQAVVITIWCRQAWAFIRHNSSNKNSILCPPQVSQKWGVQKIFSLAPLPNLYPHFQNRCAALAAKWHLNTQNGLSTVHECDRQTYRQTDHATQKCVGIVCRQQQLFLLTFSLCH